MVVILKYWPAKGLCCLCLSEFRDWWYCTVSHVGIFDPALGTVAPLTFSLFLLSPLPSPLPCVNKYTVLCTRIQCIRGEGVWGSGPQIDKHLPHSPFTHFALSSVSPIFLRRPLLTKNWQHLRLATRKKDQERGKGCCHYGGGGGWQFQRQQTAWFFFSYPCSMRYCSVCTLIMPVSYFIRTNKTNMLYLDFLSWTNNCSKNIKQIVKNNKL